MSAYINSAPINRVIPGKIDPKQLPENVVHAGRGWKRFGLAMLIAGTFAVIIGIVAICILTTRLGNHLSHAGAGGARLVNWMATHANPILIASFGATLAGGLVIIPIGIFSRIKGNNQYKLALEEEKSRAIHSIE